VSTSVNHESLVNSRDEPISLELFPLIFIISS
jgi:hypothetical protein